MFAVGIKGAKRQELLDIAQGKKTRVFNISNFEKLNSELSEDIAKAVCEAESNTEP